MEELWTTLKSTKRKEGQTHQCQPQNKSTHNEFQTETMGTKIEGQTQSQNCRSF